MSRVPENKSHQGAGSAVRKGFNGAFRTGCSILIENGQSHVNVPGL